jgi:hypothetical protein
VNGNRLSRWQWGTMAVATTGALLRLVQFFSGRSLWYDESLLALNVVHRSFQELFRPLDYHQGAPIGFLLLEKLSTQLAGKGELALRAIPLLAGLISLFVFHEVARLYLSPKAVPIAFILFSLSRSLVYYSSEAKQYSTDVLVTLVLLQVVFKLSKDPPSRQRLFEASGVGALAIWFSHPASFVLAGAATVLVIASLWAGNAQTLRRMMWMFCTWAGSFALCYMVSLRFLSRDTVLVAYWRGTFPPHTPSQIVPWVIYSFFTALENPAPLNALLGASLFVAGLGQLLRERKRSLGFLIAPLIVLFLASLLNHYPLYGRLLLFACPILLLVVAEGALWAYNTSRRLTPAAGIALLGLLLAKPVYLAVDGLIHPPRPDNIKWAIQYIQSRQHPTDVWYVYYGAVYQFIYYSELYHLTGRVRLGADCGSDRTCYTADVTPLLGDGRVWALLSHILVHDGVDEGIVLQDQMDSLGARLDAYRTSGARADLYDFSRPPGRFTRHD